MIEIDFFGGLHGNFLCYCINALADEVKKISPFTTLGTSHRPYVKTLAIADHYTLKNKKTGKNVISITCDKEDSLLLALLNFSRAGDYKFDLKNFNINLYSQIKRTSYSSGLTDALKNKYNVDITVTDSVHRGVLRDHFKNEFSTPWMFLIIKVHEQKYDFPVFWYNVRTFYNKDLFIKSLYDIKQYFNLPHNIDVEWYSTLWEQFISKVTQINDANYAKQVLLSVQNKEEMVIDFNILQEAWLNSELEKLYNITMPMDQDEYFKNTKEIVTYLKL